MEDKLFWAKFNEKLLLDNWKSLDYYIFQSYQREGKKIMILDVSGQNNNSYFQNVNIEYINIPLKELINNINKINSTYNKIIICVCAIGSKSAVAAQILRFKGYDASSLIGGIEAITKINTIF